MATRAPTPRPSTAPSAATAAAPARAKRATGVVAYLNRTAKPANAILLVMPLFVLYQLGILLTDGWKNGADFVTPWLLALTGGNLVAYAVLNLVVLGVMGWLWHSRRTGQGVGLREWGLLVVESSVYAVVLGTLVANTLLRIGITPRAAQGMPPDSNDALATAAGADWGTGLWSLAGTDGPDGVLNAIVLSIGAGTYEELVFRVFLMGGLLAGLTRWTKLGATNSALIALGVSSFIFSAFHYVPLGMDPWDLWSFSFRLALGALFGLLYWTRGFAVVVYTHAIYDIFILLPRALLG